MVQTKTRSATYNGGIVMDVEGPVKFFLKKTPGKHGVALTNMGQVFLPAVNMRIKNRDGTLHEEFNGKRVFPCQGDTVVITKMLPDRKGFFAIEWYVKPKPPPL